MKVVTESLAKEPGVLVTVCSTEGSAPREPGAWMLVLPRAMHGTIGGGHVEHECIAHARAMLAAGAREDLRRYALGPSLGQCCGGRMELRFERVTAADAASLAVRLARPMAPVSYTHLTLPTNREV